MMQCFGKVALAPHYCCFLALAAIFFGVGNAYTTETPTPSMYSPGGLTLGPNQSVSLGSITLQMRSDCILALTSASGGILWQSARSTTPCFSPEAAFERDGNLSV